MPNQIPETVFEFVVQQLEALSTAARLAVVLDPDAGLALGDCVETARGAWRVTRYDGNDLAFRQTYRPGERDLIWATCPPGGSRVELRSMVDVWRRAERFVDASLPGVLRQLAPRESWPAGAVAEHANVFGQNLPAVIAGLQTLRRHIDRGAALDSHSVRALALHCLQPGLPAHDLLFRQDTPAAVLGAYVHLLWAVPWSASGMELLQTQAREAPRLPLGTVAAWLDASPASLAAYVYLRRLLGRYQVRGIANQLRGLGLLDLDPELLEPWAESVLSRWEQQPDWRRQIVSQAEATLQAEDLGRIVALLDLDSPDEAFQALIQAETPATVAALGTHFFQTAVEAKQIKPLTIAWAQRRPAALADLPQTPFTKDAVALAGLLDELAAVNRRRAIPLPAQADLAQLLDWYVESELYDLEYAHARAGRHALDLRDEALRRIAQRYLAYLQGKIRQRLDELDHALAGRIAENWSGYLGHPRLSTNVLWDTVKRRRLSPTSEACLWIVVFDGMRWDTWVRHVKPRLLDKFELVAPEKAYLSLLPSWTTVARTGLLAGRPPAGWKSYEDRYSTDQEQLASRLFDLPQRDRHRLLRFYSGMESDRQYSQLDPGERLPYNVLIYNISDDNLHSQRGNLVELNRTVDQLLDSIFQVLDNLVRPGDTVVVSSDHGFVELVEGNEQAVAEDDRWQRYREGGTHPVRYRYALTHDLPDGLPDVYKVDYPGVRDDYTVTIGKRWLKRAGWQGPTDRYAHGGLSFAEMAVPGAVLRRIVEPRIELSLETDPRALQLQEGAQAALIVRVANQGNVAAGGRLEVQADTAGEPVLYAVDLRPGEKQGFSYQVEAIYRRRSDRTVQMTQTVNCVLTYNDLSGRARTKRKQVAVEVAPRTDVVEIDLSGLDDLDV